MQCWKVNSRNENEWPNIWTKRVARRQVHSCMHKHVCLLVAFLFVQPVVTAPLEELLMFGLIILEPLQLPVQVRFWFSKQDFCGKFRSKPVEKSKYYHRCDAPQIPPNFLKWIHSTFILACRAEPSLESQWLYRLSPHPLPVPYGWCEYANLRAGMNLPCRLLLSSCFNHAKVTASFGSFQYVPHTLPYVYRWLADFLCQDACLWWQ